MTTMSFIRQNNVVLTAWSHCRNAEQRVTVKYQKNIYHRDLNLLMFMGHDSLCAIMASPGERQSVRVNLESVGAKRKEQRERDNKSDGRSEKKDEDEKTRGETARGLAKV